MPAPWLSKQVAIVMGSRSDWPTTMRHVAEMLDRFQVGYEAKVVSAHRTPERLYEFAKTAHEAGFRVIIAGAGGAAHLPGMISALTHLPVLGVPVESRILRGVDSLLSIVQMPGGVPTATFAIGEAGAKNAALFAVRIIAVEDGRMKQAYLSYMRELAASVPETVEDEPEEGGMHARTKETFAERLIRAKNEDEERIALLRRHLTPIGTGKARHLFEVPGHPELMAVYVSDAWSAYDFSFGFVIPDKGVILNLSTIAAKRILRKEGHLVDLVAYGTYIDEYLKHPELRHRRDLQERVTIVAKCAMILYEVVFRKHLYGTAWATYSDPKNNRIVCGQQLPEGLPLFAEFDRMLSSPTTKAKVGHDLPVTIDEVERREPGLLGQGIQIAETLSRLYRTDGLGRLLDGKFEFGRDSLTGELVLCDEVSPDSVRLAAESEFAELAPGQAPARFLDKEYGRQWAAARGIKALKPTWKRHRERVKRWRPDEAFVDAFLQRYHEGFQIISRGFSIDEYKRDAMSLHR